MMARSRTKPIAGAIGEDSAKASAPASPVPKGLRDMRRLLRRPPRLVGCPTTFVVRLACIRISRKRAPRRFCRASLGATLRCCDVHFVGERAHAFCDQLRPAIDEAGVNLDELGAGAKLFAGV